MLIELVHVNLYVPDGNALCFCTPHGKGALQRMGIFKYIKGLYCTFMHAMQLAHVQLSIKCSNCA